MISATHYIIDLETLGTGDTAAIVTIGIVCVAQGKFRSEIYLHVDPHNSTESGLQTLDYKTVTWWLEQSEEARAELTCKPRTSMATALQKVAEFMGYSEHYGHKQDTYVWGNGDDFDCNILRSAYKKHWHQLPWHHSANQNLRTLLALYPQAKEIAGPFIGTRHHALHDARHEARRLLAALKLHAGQTGSIAEPSNPAGGAV